MQNRHTFQKWWDEYFEEKKLDWYCIGLPVKTEHSEAKDLIDRSNLAVNIVIKLKCVARDAYIAGAKKGNQDEKNNSKD